MSENKKVTTCPEKKPIPGMVASPEKKPIPGMTTCPICHRDFPLIAEEAYIARNVKSGGLVASLTGTEPTIYDVIDCPHCGCQVRLQERLRVHNPMDDFDLELEDDDADEFDDDFDDEDPEDDFDAGEDDAEGSEAD